MGLNAVSATVPSGIDPDFAKQLSQIEPLEPRTAVVSFQAAPNWSFGPDPAGLEEMSVFTPIPEPSTWLTGAIAGAAIFYNVSRRHLNQSAKRISR